MVHDNLLSQCTRCLKARSNKCLKAFTELGCMEMGKRDKIKFDLILSYWFNGDWKEFQSRNSPVNHKIRFHPVGLQET